MTDASGAPRSGPLAPEALVLEALAPADLGALAAALDAAGLPSDDLAEPGRRYWRCRDAAGVVVGHAGVEDLGDSVVLLRSLVVDPARRGRGLGALVVGAVLGAAGAHEAWLLTTDAAPFFARLGFAAVPRAAAPDALRATRQFAGLCPGSAALMHRVAPGPASAPDRPPA